MRNHRERTRKVSRVLVDDQNRHKAGDALPRCRSGRGALSGSGTRDLVSSLAAEVMLTTIAFAGAAITPSAAMICHIPVLDCLAASGRQRLAINVRPEYARSCSGSP